MYIKNHVLSKNKLTTLTLEENLESAVEKIKSGDFLSLPVLSDDGEKFEGILLKETIYRKFYEGTDMPREEYLKKTKVRDIYNPEYKSVHSEDYIEKASSILRYYNTPFLPVFDSDENFIGIITHAAIFKAFYNLFGLDNGERIFVRISDKPGEVAKLTEIFEKERININSMILADPKMLGIQQAILTVNAKDITSVMDRLARKGFQAYRLDM